MLRARRALASLGLVAALAGGCADLRHFEGEWEGVVSPDPAHQRGFSPGARLHATIFCSTRDRLALDLTLPGAGTEPVPFRPIKGASADALGELTFAGDPLRAHLGFVGAPGAEAYLAVVALFPEERIAIRLIRGPEESYGVFTLARELGPEKPRPGTGCAASDARP
jgi:hypothetical protein